MWALILAITVGDVFVRLFLSGIHFINVNQIFSICVLLPFKSIHLRIEDEQMILNFQNKIFVQSKKRFKVQRAITSHFRSH